MTAQPLIFMGSGPVAAASLALLHKHQTIAAVITKPTTEREMTEVSGGAPVYTVTNKRELDELVTDNFFPEASLGVLIDFGIIVTQHVIDHFKYGIINSHFSVLPSLRGADPISFAILSGQPTTGVSLMLIDEGMDTGMILVTKSIPIANSDTTPSLTEKLIELSDSLLKQYIPSYLSGTTKPRKQSHPDRATYTRKLTKEDGNIDWQKSAMQIEREIRAFKEWPKSYTVLGGKDVVITNAHADSANETLAPGTVTSPDKQSLGIATSDGILWIDSLKPAGKKEMPVQAFLAGYRHLFV